jgi:16S rRNA (guanine527-N7)-methyltransferase
MQPADIARLLAPFLGDDALTPEQSSAVSTYLDLLLRWNARINLTAVRDPESMITRHFGESFFAARKLFPASVNVNTKIQSLSDVGSGAGFPGLPCRILYPISLTLIESNQRKSTFLREVIRALSLSDATVLNTRAEDVPPAIYDVVTLRAVERFELILPTAARLVAPGGRLALLIGSSQLDLARATLADWSWHEPVPIPLSDSRILAIAEKR